MEKTVILDCLGAFYDANIVHQVDRMDPYEIEIAKTENGNRSTRNQKSSRDYYLSAYNFAVLNNISNIYLTGSNGEVFSALAVAKYEPLHINMIKGTYTSPVGTKSTIDKWREARNHEISKKEFTHIITDQYFIKFYKKLIPLTGSKIKLHSIERNIEDNEIPNITLLTVKNMTKYLASF
jgi:hypothetical protein